MGHARPLLVLLTESYPYHGPDDPFLPREVQVLSRHFDIRLVPTRPIEKSGAFALGSTQTVDLALSKSSNPGLAGTARNLFSSGVMEEMRDHKVRALSAQAVTARRWARVNAGQRWVRTNLATKLGDRPTLVYSWWGVPEAAGVAMELSRMTASVPMVTRLHGYDLFAEQDRLGFIPFQRRLIESVDKVYSVSQAGQRYLQTRYPSLAHKIGMAYLGVDKSPALSPQSEDGVFRILSCSSLVPVKRINVLVEAVKILIDNGESVAWAHIGDGPQASALRAQATQLGPHARFLGQMPRTDVLAWMASNPIDVFCNVSFSEGLPVTLMEAASCGIPLMATDVGGNSEIVDSSVGRLISGSANAEAIAQTLSAMIGQSDAVKRGWRRRSYERWQSTFQADRNYNALVTQLEEILGRAYGHWQ